MMRCVVFVASELPVIARHFSRRQAFSALAAGALALAEGGIARASDLTPQEFQRFVIDTGARHFPSLPIRPGRSALEVLWGDHHLYLNNIFAAIGAIPLDKRESVVADFLNHFSPEADARAAALRASIEDWHNASPRLRPKLFPLITVIKAPQLVAQPLVQDVVIGYALDLGDKDLYVDDRKLKAWNRTLDEVHDAAIANLEDMSKNLGIYPPRPEGSLGAQVVFDTGDGYDAARILLPGLRTRLFAALGPDVMAGVPARDLFVAWSSSLPNKQEFEKEIRDDAARMPHPVTEKIFVIEPHRLRLAETSEL